MSGARRRRRRRRRSVRSAPPAQHPVAAARKREKERALGSVSPGVNTPRGMDSVVKDAILEPPATRTVTRRVTYLVANKDARCILYLGYVSAYLRARARARAFLQIYRDPSYVLRIHGKVSPVLFFSSPSPCRRYVTCERGSNLRRINRACERAHIDFTCRRSYCDINAAGVMIRYDTQCDYRREGLRCVFANKCSSSASCPSGVFSARVPCRTRFRISV